MGLFNFKKKNKKTGFPIIEEDKNWVIENLTWLVQAYGVPHADDKTVVFSQEFFPLTSSREGDKVENLIADLKSILGLESTNITFDLQEDIRDFEGLPYELNGRPFQSGLIVAEGQYHIILARSLLKHDATLLASLINEFLKIRLTNDQQKYDTGEDADLFLYLAGVYWGFGPLLYQSLVNTGRSSDGYWETKWNFVADLPREVMAYAIALRLDLQPQEDLSWKGELSNELEYLLDAAIEYQKQNPVSLVMKGESEADGFYAEGLKLFEQFDWERAKALFHKALLLEASYPLKADIHNSLGYCYMRMGDLEGALANFQIAIDLNGHAYAFSNMAYVMIVGGRPDTAKGMIDMTFEINSLPGYAHRNTAMYHQAIGNNELAEEHFQKALATQEPVDLLEFHYYEFLFTLGRRDEALIFLQKAVEKGEPEAVAEYQVLGF